MKTAFIQSVGGASGDMLLGALLDAGLSRDAVSETIDALCIPGVDIAAGTETRCEVRGTRVLVDVSAAPRYTPQQMLDTVAGADGLSEQTRELATKVLNALFAAEARVHGDDPDQIHLHELGNRRHPGGRGGCRPRIGTTRRRACLCCAVGPGRAHRPAPVRRLQQPGAGHAGDHRGRRRASGAGAAIPRRRRRVDHSYWRGA